MCYMNKKVQDYKRYYGYEDVTNILLLFHE